MVTESYRLPRHALPRRYELELAPDLEAGTFGGQVEVDLDLVAAASELVLNSLDLEVGAVELATPTGERLPGRVVDNPAEQQISILFDRELAPAGGYRLSARFSGRLNEALRGFYRSTFVDQSGRERLIATTQFESTDARRAFPCWDEPDFKARFQITLVVEEGLTGLSNAELESSATRDDGRTVLRFRETMVMSTYLVAFIVGPYELSDPVHVEGVPVRVAAPPGKLHLTQFPLEVAAHALQFLAAYFEIPYPGGKIDHVAVPDFAAGAMENLGCVTYRENYLLADPAGASSSELQLIALVIAHETAHMWFGDLVTMKWWNGIWLNEAFATFMEYTTADAYRPEWQVWTAFGAGKAGAMAIDGLQSTRPVEFPVGRPEEAEAMFDVLTYQKGGSVLRMLEQYLGPESFRKGIAHYLSIHSYSNTETTDLWDALETVTGQPARSIMDSWIGQGGYPEIAAEVSPDDPSTVLLRQRRFLYRPDTASKTAARWSVPVNLRASVGGSIRHEKVLLDGEEASVTFSGPVDWVVLNDGAWGFYRSRYSPDLWSALRGAGPSQVLQPLERLGLVDDLWAGVIAGSADLSEWVDAALAVSADPDPDVWLVLATVLHSLNLMADEDERPALAAFARRLAAPAWETVGWEARPGESDRTSTARARILTVIAEVGDDAEVIAENDRRMAAHLAGHRALPPDLVGSAARIAVMKGDVSDWEEVCRGYLAADLQDKLRYLQALGRAPSEESRARALELALSEHVRSQNIHVLLGALLSQREPQQAWSWVQGNWGRIAERVTTALLLRILEPAALFVRSEIAESVRRFASSTETGVSPLRLEQVLERMDAHVAAATRLRGTIGQRWADPATRRQLPGR